MKERERRILKVKERRAERRAERERLENELSEAKKLL